LENELISLSLSNFNTIQDFFTKFKSLLLQLKLCGIDKKEEQLILSILSKLGPKYSVFVSTFHATKSTFRAAWKMPSLDDFSTSLTHEKDKLVQMGSLKTTKVHALAANEGRKTSNKLKQQFKGKKDQDQKKEHNPKSTQESSNSKTGKTKKEKVICAYCKKPNHEEHACMRKQIDQMTHLLERHNINVPDNIKKKDEKSEKPQDDKGKGKETGHALVVVSSSLSTWVLDSRALNHMASSQGNIYFFGAMHQSYHLNGR
jgi:hypothetical protein